MQFLTGRGYFLFVAEKPSPTGEGGPKGRMRGESAAKSRERVAAEALPSSVRFADSFPRGGSLFYFLPLYSRGVIPYRFLNSRLK